MIIMPIKLLTVFDFDHTVVCDNSDVVLRNLLPVEVLQGKKLKGLRPSWTAYMAEVFRQLPQNGIDKQKILQTCRDLVSNDGFIDLIKHLHDLQAEIMILSDANSEIITTWLGHNIPEIPVQVITNSAAWGEDGVLKVKPYHQQMACRRCPINLCKGAVLEKHLDGKEYQLVVYVGDGKNDYCPSLKLRACDLVCARAGFALEAQLKEDPVDARCCYWTSGLQILQEIRQLLQ